MLNDLLLALVATPIPSPPAGAELTESQLTQPQATLLAGLIVGFGALLGFSASLLNVRILDKATKTTDKRETMSARQDRFTTIAEQLSSEHEPVRLAGVYSLSALADEWQEAGNAMQRNVCADLLCAYLRAKPRPDDDQVRSAIFSVISGHTHKKSAVKWPGPIIDLVGADLRGAHFMMVDLSDVNLSGADLSEASFLHVDFTNARLFGAKVEEATFMECDLSSAFLDEASFRDSSLSQVNMFDASLWKTDFAGTQFREVNMSGGRIGYWLSSEENSFPKVVDSTVSPPKQAKWDKKTVWPDRFDPDKHLSLS